MCHAVTLCCCHNVTLVALPRTDIATYLFQGALTGGIASLVIMGWISVGNELMSIEGRLNYPTLPVNVSGCVPPLPPVAIPTME